MLATGQRGAANLRLTAMGKTDYEAAYRAHISRWGVGATLRGAREAGGETIQDVAGALRIRAEYIHALEVEDFQRLPGWAYALSFVRTYAEYLGLEALPLVKKVREQFELRQHMNQQPVEPERERGGRRLAAIAALLVIVAVAGGWYMTNPAISLDGLLDPVPRGIKNFINRTFVTVADTGEVAGVPEVLALSADVTAPPAAEPATPAPAATTAEVPRTRALPQSAPVAASEPSAPVAGSVLLRMHPAGAIDRDLASTHSVIVRARGPVRLTLENQAGEVLLAQQLKAGELYRLPTGSGITMSADDAGALEVYVEGSLAGLIGPAGQRVSRFPVDRLTAGRADG